MAIFSLMTKIGPNWVRNFSFNQSHVMSFQPFPTYLGILNPPNVLETLGESRMKKKSKMMKIAQCH